MSGFQINHFNEILAEALHKQAMTQMKLEDKVSRNVERPVAMDMDTLVAHLKAIGGAIIDDADHLAVDTNRLCMVRIEAEIAPCYDLTTVTYTLERIADPRIK